MTQRIFLVAALTFLTVAALNYFGPQPAPQPQVPTDIVPGQSYKVPTHEELLRPVKREVDFIDAKREDEKVISMSTQRYKLSFSTYGGVLSRLDFLEYTNHDDIPLRSVHPKTYYEQEQGCFLLAFEEKTPFFYRLVDSTHDESSIRVSFAATVDGWEVVKTYQVDADAYTINLTCQFTPKSKDIQPLRPRLFTPSPFVPELQGDAVNGVFLGGGSGAVEKVSATQRDEQAWVMPELFGSENKFFAHILVKDEEKFVQRGFYAALTEHQFAAVLEGPEVAQATTFTLSFYMGPKAFDELVAVDQRLEGLMSFGWLSWLCKILLKLLQWIYGMVGNYGYAIILLTILLRIPAIPLTFWGRNQAVTYQKHQPALDRIRKKFKNDTQRCNEELVAYHKRHNISPASMLYGCLTGILTMPIFFALYRVLYYYVDLYNAPFIWWITDLSAKDPYYVLPVIMAVAMFASMKVSMVPGQQQTSLMIAPLLMLGFFINFPAGAVLFWAMNSLLGFFEEVARKKLMSA